MSDSSKPELDPAMRKQSVYLAQSLVDAMNEAAIKADRPLSYIVQQACTHWLQAGKPNVRPIGRRGGGGGGNGSQA